MITENTIIKLYSEYAGDDLSHGDICTKIVDGIVTRFTKTNKYHPLKELFINEEERVVFYELVHFVFSVVETHRKRRKVI